MGKRRWVGLRSRSFRRTLLVLGLISLFCIGFWLGKRQHPAEIKNIKVLEQQIQQLELQVNQLKQNTKTQ